MQNEENFSRFDRWNPLWSFYFFSVVFLFFDFWVTVMLLVEAFLFVEIAHDSLNEILILLLDRFWFLLPIGLPRFDIDHQVRMLLFWLPLVFSFTVIDFINSFHEPFVLHFDIFGLDDTGACLMVMVYSHIRSCQRKAGWFAPADGCNSIYPLEVLLVSLICVLIL